MAYQTIPSPAGTVEHHHDPLLAAIRLAHFLGEEYDNIPEDAENEDAEFQRLCAAPDDVLRGWSEPAVTREGAIAAMRLAIERRRTLDLADADEGDLVLSMMRAVLGYLEGGQK